MRRVNFKCFPQCWFTQVTSWHREGKQEKSVIGFSSHLCFLRYHCFLSVLKASSGLSCKCGLWEQLGLLSCRYSMLTLLSLWALVNFYRSWAYWSVFSLLGRSAWHSQFQGREIYLACGFRGLVHGQRLHGRKIKVEGHRKMLSSWKTGSRAQEKNISKR